MKKYVLFLLVVAAITVVGVQSGEASFSAVAPFISGIAQDDMVGLSRFQLDGFAHAVITFNNTNQTAFAVILDPDGNPDTVYFNGYAYLFADYFTHQLYGSPDGISWFLLGSI